MSSRTERLALAAWLLLAALGCPDEAPPLLVPPPPPSPEDAGIAAPAMPPAAARVETLDAVVFEFGGKAEVRRAGAEEWVALSVGDAVRVSDEVRTSPEGHLEMRFGDARIQVHEGSELVLKFLEPRAIRAEVRGLASGSATDGGELTFEGQGGGVRVVATGSGMLSLDATEQRAFVSSVSGTTRLTSGGTTVEVHPGELASARGSQVSRPAPIPKKVTLSVRWPPQAETNQPTLVLKGTTSAYARVLVLGRRVDPGADGSFEVQVPLKRGSQTVWVQAVDPLGRHVADRRQITFDPNAPAITGKVEYR